MSERANVKVIKKSATSLDALSSVRLVDLQEMGYAVLRVAVILRLEVNETDLREIARLVLQERSWAWLLRVTLVHATKNIGEGCLELR
jgi:hypothetical protein